MLKKFEESEDLLLSCVKESGTNYVAWTEFGRLYIDINEIERAEFCLMESLKHKVDFNVFTMFAGIQLQINPQWAWTNAGNALQLEPGWEEAIAIRDRARRLIDEKEATSARSKEE